MPRRPLSALAARIVFVDTEVEMQDGTDDEGKPIMVLKDLALEGNYFVSVEYYDPIEPAVVIQTMNFSFAHSVDKLDAHQRIHDFGQRILWARTHADRMSVGEIINIIKPDVSTLRKV
jgi:hypothetical protein